MRLAAERAGTAGTRRIDACVPGDVFMGEELVPGGDGRVEAAVHLGAHHGLYGSLLLVSGLLVSRIGVASRLGTALDLVSGALVSYGAISLVQDRWLEQLVKRDWVSWRIPSAILPAFDAVTGVWLAGALGVAWLLRRERAILRP